MSQGIPTIIIWKIRIKKEMNDFGIIEKAMICHIAMTSWQAPVKARSSGLLVQQSALTSNSDVYPYV